jgi:hypothetical protein
MTLELANKSWLQTKNIPKRRKRRNRLKGQHLCSSRISLSARQIARCGAVEFSGSGLLARHMSQERERETTRVSSISFPFLLGLFLQNKIS